MPLLFLPLGIFYILLILYIFFKKITSYFRYTLFLWISSTHFVFQTLLRLVEKPWEQKNYESIEKGNAIVVLGGGLHPTSKKRKLQSGVIQIDFFLELNYLKREGPFFNFHIRD